MRPRAGRETYRSLARGASGSREGGHLEQIRAFATSTTRHFDGRLREDFSTTWCFVGRSCHPVGSACERLGRRCHRDGPNVPSRWALLPWRWHDVRILAESLPMRWRDAPPRWAEMPALWHDAPLRWAEMLSLSPDVPHH